MLYGETEARDEATTKRAILELTNDENSYLNRVRIYGEGEVRIGKSIYLHDDIYSIGFISQLRDDVMKKYLNISTGKLLEEGEEEQTEKPVEEIAQEPSDEVAGDAYEEVVRQQKSL